MERNISPYEKKHGFDEESTRGTKSLLNDYEEGIKTFQTDATAPMDIKAALEEAAKLGGELLIPSNIYASIPRVLEAEERLVQKLQSIASSN